MIYMYFQTNITQPFDQVNKEKCVETSLSSLPILNQINIFLYHSPSITS